MIRNEDHNRNNSWILYALISGVTLNKLRYSLLNSNIELHSRKKNKSTAFNEIIIELLEPSISCVPHTCTFKIMEVTDKEVYFHGQTSSLKFTRYCQLVQSMWVIDTEYLYCRVVQSMWVQYIYIYIYINAHILANYIHVSLQKTKKNTKKVLRANQLEYENIL